MGECRAACGKFAGFKTLTTAKVVSSTAKYGGEECDLEPHNNEVPCTTDCCPGKLENAIHFSAAIKVCSQLSVMRVKQTAPAAPVVVRVE